MVVAAALAACGGDDGGDGGGAEPTVSMAAPPMPSVTTAASGSTGATDTAGATPQGFDTVAGTVLAADGTPCEVCLWRADDGAERGRGLMGVTDLGGADGMAFVYAEPTTTAFYMQDTLLALSIAFFGPDGAYLDAFDMDPCTTDPCPVFPTPEGFTVAVEVPQGGLDELGIGPGSRLDLTGEGCPLDG